MSREIRDLIRQKSRANPLWGAPRIHGELLKIGVEVSQATVGRYLPWRPRYQVTFDALGTSMTRVARLCAATATMFIASPVAEAAPPEQVRTLVECICAINNETWVEAEMVDGEAGQKPAYDTHHAECRFQLFANGNWYSFDYRRTRHVSRRWGWSEQRESLVILILWINSIDVQNTQPILTQTVSDRNARGKATFGIRGVLGRIDTAEHFYDPPNPTLGDEVCVAEACDSVGKEYAGDWQNRYDEAIVLALARIKEGTVR